MHMQDRAINLMALLQNHGIGKRPLCFVAHSMGGLLVKEILLHAAESRTDYGEFAQAARGVVFMGTPHTGSGLAMAVKALGAVYRGTAAVKDLKRNSAHLRQLGDRYRDWAAGSGVRNLVFFEAYPTKGVQVVDAGSRPTQAWQVYARSLSTPTTSTSANLPVGTRWCTDRSSGWSATS
jgi:pimeloyl-ACP methyl ester carboxylesterase